MSEMKTIVHLKPYDYTIGGKDNDGIEVEKIYAKAPDYIIYRTKTSIRLDMDDESERIDEYSLNHYKIGVVLARIYSWLPEDLSSSEPINKQLARAMATNVAGNFDDAQVMLAHAEERIIKLKTLIGKIQYTLSAFMIVAIIAIVLQFINSESSILFAQVMLCGALGGLLSITVGYSKLTIDIDANWKTNSLVGGSRIVIAVTASLFSYFAIQSGIAFSFVKDVPLNYGVFLIAMTAGFAEMLVPNMMNNLVKEAGNSSN
jgi:hypothetical protein